MFEGCIRSDKRILFDGKKEEYQITDKVISKYGIADPKCDAFMCLRCGKLVVSCCTEEEMRQPSFAEKQEHELIILADGVSISGCEIYWKDSEREVRKKLKEANIGINRRDQIGTLYLGDKRHKLRAVLYFEDDALECICGEYDEVYYLKKERPTEIVEHMDDVANCFNKVIMEFTSQYEIKEAMGSAYTTFQYGNTEIDINRDREWMKMNINIMPGEA